jgi:HlyD family secretion protein
MTGGPDQLLRKASIERLSSPEQLDMMMRVTSPVGWIALVAVGSLIVAGIVWSVVFEMSVKVDGQGIFVRGDNVLTVQAVGGGTVASVDVNKGDLVAKNQVIGKLALPDLENRLATARLQLQDMERNDRSAGSDMAAIAGGMRAQLGRLQAERRQKAALVERGLLTSQVLISLDQQITNIQSSLLQSEIGRGDRGSRVGDKRLEVLELEAKLESDSVIRSSFAGRVVAVLAGPGQQVRPGDRVLTLESEDEPMRFVGYIPLIEGKKVAAGLEARISPSNVRPEEFGFILGKVTSVSEYAATPEELKRTLSNDQLASKFAESTPFQIFVQPVLQDDNKSGFKWTSSQGPPITIGSGTFCTVQVVVERRKPISYVIPSVKQTLGLS